MNLYMYVKRKIVTKLPKEERFELTSQLLRASLSIPLSIVEGCRKFTDKDFTRFLDTSLGSTNETDYGCFAAYQLGYITEQEYNTVNKMVNEVRARLISLSNTSELKNANRISKSISVSSILSLMPYALHLMPCILHLRHSKTTP